MNKAEIELKTQNVDKLSPRELEVLELLVYGMPDKAIGPQLGISLHTVKIHIHNIIRVLEVKNRTGVAAVYFIRTIQNKERQESQKFLGLA